MPHPPHPVRAPEGPQGDGPQGDGSQGGLPRQSVVVVTGLSGAGKSSVLHALEDLFSATRRWTIRRSG